MWLFQKLSNKATKKLYFENFEKKHPTVNNSQLQARSHRFLHILGTTLSSPEPPNLSIFAWFCRFFHRFGENFHGLFSNNQLQLQNLSIKLKDISQNLQYSAFFPSFSLNFEKLCLCVHWTTILTPLSQNGWWCCGCQGEQSHSQGFRINQILLFKKKYNKKLCTKFLLVF